MPWQRRRPDPAPDLQAAIDDAVRVNHATRRDAHHAQHRATSLAARVERIHTVLMAEAEANHFTERWQRALRGES